MSAAKKVVGHEWEPLMGFIQREDELPEQIGKCSCGEFSKIGVSYDTWRKHAAHLASLQGTPPAGEVQGGMNMKEQRIEGKTFHSRGSITMSIPRFDKLRGLATEILRVNEYPGKYPITKDAGWKVLVEMAKEAVHG